MPPARWTIGGSPSWTPRVGRAWPKSRSPAGSTGFPWSRASRRPWPGAGGTDWCPSWRPSPGRQDGSFLTDRFGFHAFSGPRLETADGRFTGRVAGHFDEYDKRDVALAQARELGLAPRSCGAVGDSRSDLPLFASVWLSVAFNASPGARAAATATVDGGDLRAVLPVLGRLVAVTRSRPPAEG